MCKCTGKPKEIVAAECEPHKWGKYDDNNKVICSNCQVIYNILTCEYTLDKVKGGCLES